LASGIMTSSSQRSPSSRVSFFHASHLIKAMLQTFDEVVRLS